MGAKRTIITLKVLHFHKKRLSIIIEQLMVLNIGIKYQIVPSSYY